MRIPSALMAAPIVAALTACGGMTPGAYEGKAQDFGGEVMITATATETEITDVVLVGGSETPTPGGNAAEDIVVFGRIAAASAIEYLSK